jgi:Na+:H+ antiporter, NhaB family
MSSTSTSLGRAFLDNFLGHAPVWYKQTILAFLILNPLLLLVAGPFVAGWLLIAEFIFTLAMALKCYPLQPGGLLALEAILIGMASPEAVMHEVEANIEVILLLMFMVAGIYFMKSMLLYVFTKVLLHVRSKMLLSILFCFLAAFLSAFLDALTVTAVLISVAVGFYTVYHKVASGKHYDVEHDHADDDSIKEDSRRADLEQFRAFLRSLLMHGAVGTALGGVMTMVGEPQNLLIANVMQWDFIEFFVEMSHVTIYTLIAGFATLIVVEKFKLCGHGETLPDFVRNILVDYDSAMTARRSKREIMAILVQGAVAVLLVFSLAFHLAAPGLIGLMIIVLQTAFNGITEEHHIGEAFHEALPFTALLVTFFAVVAVIQEQHLFTPLVEYVFTFRTEVQPALFFLANGLLSSISDNVFVATVYIGAVTEQYNAGAFSKEHYDALAVAVNTGTNLPSVATPNGQAAFLFLLTSALAPLIRLSYGRMVMLALPYTIVLTVVGFLCVYLHGA